MQLTRGLIGSTAMLMGLIVTTLPAAAGWQATEWGMSKEQVETAVPEAVLNEDRGKDAQELRAELRSLYQSSGIDFEATFLFAPDQTLVRVDLTPLADADCPKLEGAARAAYGAPESDDKQHLFSFTQWRDTTAGNLLSLFRITNSSCSLTYKAMPAAGAPGGL